MPRAAQSSSSKSTAKESTAPKKPVAKRAIFFSKCPHTCAHTKCRGSKAVHCDYIFSATIGSAFRQHMESARVHRKCKAPCPMFNVNPQGRLRYPPAKDNILEFWDALTDRFKDSVHGEIAALNAIKEGSDKTYDKEPYHRSKPEVMADDVSDGSGNDDIDSEIPRRLGSLAIHPSTREGSSSPVLDKTDSRSEGPALPLQRVEPIRPQVAYVQVPPIQWKDSGSRTSQPHPPQHVIPANSPSVTHGTTPLEISFPVLPTPRSLVSEINSVWVTPENFTGTDFYESKISIILVDAPWYKSTPATAIINSWMVNAEKLPKSLQNTFKDLLPGFMFLEKDHPRKEDPLCWEWVRALLFSFYLVG